MLLALTLSGWAMAQPLDEVSGTEHVCRSSPAAEVSRAIRLRGDAAVTAARVLPNPELSLEHDRILTGEGSHETTIGVGVPLGLGGRRSLLGDSARARRAAAHAEAETNLFEQALEFRETFAQAAVEQARVRVLEEHQRELEGLATVIRGLARAGEVAGFDLARQQAQVRLHRRALDSARARAASSRRLVEAWLGTPVRVSDTALGGMSGGAELGARARSDRRLGDHPRVRSLEAEARGASLEAKAARRRAVPDLGVFVGYRTVTAPAGTGSETGHGFRVGLSVPLPFFDHGQGEAARADAEGSAARATAARLRREQKARAASELARLDTLERSSKGMDRAVEESESLGAKARALYAAGELSLTELLDTYRAVEETRLGRLDLASELANARLGLMRALGTQLDARLDRACGRQP